MFLNKYKLIANYRDNDTLRNSFYTFTEKVFSGLSFQNWYETGYWTNQYIPFSLFKDEMIVANVSISKMNLIVEGKQTNGIQIGTVGTLPEHRNKGLSKYLMEYVLSGNENQSDLIFLFANDSVIKFYPKFGFQRKFESIFILKNNITQSLCSARKLDYRQESDLKIIKDRLKKRKILTEILGASDYDFITMWHIIYVYSDQVYYLEKENIIIICSVIDDQFHLWDIIMTEEINLDYILTRIMPKKNIKLIYFHFPPDQLQFDFDQVIPDTESILFVKGDFSLKNNQFKFPITAQT